MPGTQQDIVPQQAPLHVLGQHPLPCSSDWIDPTAAEPTRITEAAAVVVAKTAFRHRHRCRHGLNDRRRSRYLDHGCLMVAMVGMPLMSLDGRRRDVGDDHHDHRRHQARELPVEVHETWVHQIRDARNARFDESNPRTGPSVAAFPHSCR